MTDSSTCFLSYSREDEHAVKPIHELIQASAHDKIVFIDAKSIRSGDDIEKVIFDALKKCEVFYVAWSRNSISSDWVDRETSFAVSMYDKTGKPKITPITLDDTPLPKSLLRFMAIDFTKHKIYRASILQVAIFLAWVVGTALLSAYGISSEEPRAIKCSLVLHIIAATITFRGLRGYIAPWNKTSSQSGVSMLFGTIVLSRRVSTCLLVYSISSALIVTYAYPF